MFLNLHGMNSHNDFKLLIETLIIKSSLGANIGHKELRNSQ